jgi:hypothetical protein
MDNSEIPSIPPPPSIPLINLPQPTISTSYDMFFKRKHIMDINGEEEYGKGLLMQVILNSKWRRS